MSALHKTASIDVTDGTSIDSVDIDNVFNVLSASFVNHSFLFSIKSIINAGKWISEKRNSFLELPLSDF